MTEEDQDLKQRVAQLESELEAEKAKGKKSIHLKVSAKGGVSLYGIRRFPITFYLEEWNQILEMGEEIRGFLAEHSDDLKTKR